MLSPEASWRSKSSLSREAASADRFDCRKRSAVVCRIASLPGSSSRMERYSSRAESILPFCRYFSAFSMRLEMSAIRREAETTSIVRVAQKKPKAGEHEGHEGHKGSVGLSVSSFLVSITSCALPNQRQLYRRNL